MYELFSSVSNHSLRAHFSQTLQYNRTLGTPGSVAQCHSQPAPHEVFQPFNRDRKEQKDALQPTVSTARDRMQENGVILKGWCDIFSLAAFDEVE